MGIWQRLQTLMRSNLNDAISKAENPEKMLNQVIEDMRNQLAQARQEVAHAMADSARLKKQVEDEQRQAGEWEQRAVLALRQERDDLARQALMRQQEHGQRATTLHDTWTKQEEDTQRLRDALRQLHERIQEAQRKKNLLIAKQKRAQAQKRIHETMSGLSDASAFEAFDRMADKIEQNERQALAAATLSEDLTGDSLDKQFKALEAGGGSDLDYKLLEMKQKMGILPPAPAQEPRALGTGAASQGALGPGQPQPAQQPQQQPSPAYAQTQAQGQGQAPGNDTVHEAELLSEFEALEEEERGRAGA